MKAAAVVLVAMTLAALVAPPAAAQQVWQDQLILNNASSPKLWQNTVYYAYSGGGYPDVWAWDAVNGSRPIIQGPKHQYPEAVYEDNLVYSDYRTGTAALYLWDPSNGSRLVSSTIGSGTRASVYGDLVVYEDYRLGSPNPRVYLWDPINGQRRISSVETSQTKPKIWGNMVIYQQGTDVYMWTAESGAARIGSGQYSAIYEDRVVMWDNAWWEYPPGGNPGVFHPGYLSEWTPTAGFRTILQHDKSTSDLNIWGDLIVGTGGMAWDPLHGFTDYSLSAQASIASVCSNQIAWTASISNNIYLSTLVPEPSSLLAVMAGLGTLCVMICRRRSEKK